MIFFYFGRRIKSSVLGHVGENTFLLASCWAVLTGGVAPKQ